MLGREYRYHIYNTTGVSVNVTLAGRQWRFSPAGAREDGGRVAHLTAAAVGAGGYGTGGTVDNTTAKWLGEILVFTAAPSAIATGGVGVYLQQSTDSGGSEWPGVGQGRLIGAATFVASSAAVSINVEV